MSYKKSIVFIVYFFLLVPLFYPLSSIHAEETSTTIITPTVTEKPAEPSGVNTLNEAREKAKQRREEQKALLKEKREAAKERRADRKAEIKEMRSNFREEIKAKMAAAKEEFQAKREAFKEKVQTLKDERKKEIVSRVDTRMATVNQNRTNRMTEALEKLTTIIQRISEKAATAKQNGKDTSAVDTAIATAQTAIATAQTAVSDQAGKEYVITITTESGLKNTVGTTVSQLQADLSATHKTVVDAKQAVVQAGMELAKVINSGNTNTATDSAATQ